ncbi:MAG: hypothetical protein H7221_00340 [Flavobacterium sp.]|nr:hypothetical protein [Flavobacterium sp.]
MLTLIQKITTIGLKYAFNKNFRVEAAVMSQIFENRTQPQFQIVLFNYIPFFN